MREKYKVCKICGKEFTYQDTEKYWGYKGYRMGKNIYTPWKYITTCSPNCLTESCRIAINRGING